MDKSPIKTCWIINFTGSQFRDKYEIEPRTWYRNLHSVTEYIYFTRLISSKFAQIIFYKSGVEMIKILITYFLSFCLFGFGFSQVNYSEIQGILTNNCTTCHGNAGGLDLSSYTNLMSGNSNNGPVITPYNHATSELWVRINSGEMPPGNNDLTNVEAGLIAQWIDEGALEEPGSGSGCTDPEAYNCADDVWSCVDGGETPADCMDAGEWPNYTFLVGTTPYINGCSYDNTNPYDGNLPVPQGGCESEPCEGYYNPVATTDDGSCDYYQSPHDDDVEFTITCDAISLDWTFWADNIAPVNAVIDGYHITRCIGDGCQYITENPFIGGGWGSNDGLNATFIVDENEWEHNVEIKYAINVKYSNSVGGEFDNYGMAIGASYVTPLALGDINGDGGWSILDIVILANCVLSDGCAVLDNGYAGDMNKDCAWSVLDIVQLANCVLNDNCLD